MRKYIPKNAKLIPEQAECKFRGELFDVYQWPQRLFGGSMATFEMLKREDTVVIIALLTPEEQKQLRREQSVNENIAKGVAFGFDKQDLLGERAEENMETKVVITYQTQPHQDWFYDYPGGRHDNSEETELEAAKREMREETGMSFESWKLVDVHQPFTKIDWLVYTFLATGFIDQAPQELDAGEKIEVLEVTLEELREYADRPNAKHLMPGFLHGIKSLDELQNLPALHEY